MDWIVTGETQTQKDLKVGTMKSRDFQMIPPSSSRPEVAGCSWRGSAFSLQIFFFLFFLFPLFWGMTAAESWDNISKHMHESKRGAEISMLFSVDEV